MNIDTNTRFMYFILNDNHENPEYRPKKKKKKKALGFNYNLHKLKKKRLIQQLLRED